MDKSTLASFWLSYFLAPFPSCPMIGKMGDADCIWSLSFGRNSYADAELGKKLQHLGANQLPDVEVFHALKRDHFKTGLPNERMARVAWKRFTLNKIPFLGQWEVNFAMWNQNQENYEANANELIAVWAPPDRDYYPTWDVIEDLGRESIRRCYKKPIIIAHEAHMARAIAVAWKQGWEAVTENDQVKDWDKDSVQPATRSFVSLNPAACWLPREIVARIAHHPVKGMVSLIPPKNP